MADLDIASALARVRGDPTQDQVNASGRLLERDRTNNSASRTIVVRRVRGRVLVRVVASSP